MRLSPPVLLSTTALWLASSLTVRAATVPDPVQPGTGLSSGAWADAVPIEVPPAANGTVPQLSLVADHRVTDGPLGTGWTLGGLSIITRHSSTGGVPNSDGADSYRLDGEPLVSVSGPGSAHYQQETYTGTRLDYDAGSNTWTAKKDGWTWTYGSAAGTGANATQHLYGFNGRSQYVNRGLGQVAVFVPPAGGLCLYNSNELCNTASWRLSKAQDPFGNVITYEYTLPSLPAGSSAGYWFESTRLPQLSEVRYAAGASLVRFNYAERADARIRFSAGTPSVQSQRLTSVEVVGRSGTAYARYELEYTDQAGTSCSGAAVSATTRPRASVLRRITRTGPSGAEPRHVLRCLTTNSEAPSWEGDSEASQLAAVIPAPHGGFSTSSDAVIPLALHLDRDGITDLLLLGVRASAGGSHTVDHAAYIASPAAANPFADATGTGDNAAAAQGWTDVAMNALDAGVWDDERGWGLADLNRDGITEIVVEQTNYVKMRWYDTVAGASRAEIVDLQPCDLRFGTFADVDGDGYTDFIRKAHDAAGSCAAVTSSSWLRNSGVAPWFDPSAPRTLDHPLERATPPAEWTSAQAPCASGVQAPVGDGPQTDAGYVAAHAHYADLNGDGLVDLAQALFACWELDATTGDYVHVYGSDYSRIFWGDGYGSFVDSGEVAGLPLTYYGNDAGTSSGVTNQRIFAPFLAAVDVDRDGAPELLTQQAPSSLSARVAGAFFRGIDEGFGQFGAGHFADGDFTDLSQDFVPAGLSYVGSAWSCYEDNVSPSVGDFDGDGFQDVMTFEYHGSGATSACGANSWCVVLRKNQRAASYGRITESVNTWGGTTRLTWGSSALGDNKNPELPMVAEVLTAVDGSEGRVELTYSGATLSDGGPTPFATVERLNPRGGLDVFGFAITDALRGKPLHAARYRTDGTLERATVYVHGRKSVVAGAGYLVDLVPPFFNPLVRQCDFELGFASVLGGQSVDLDGLIDECYQWGSLSVPGIDRDLKVVTGHVLRPVAGDDRDATLMASLWKRQAFTAGDGAQLDSLALEGRALAGDAWYLPDGTWNHVLLGGPPGLDFPAPAGIALPSVIEPGNGYVYPSGLLPTAQRFYITDWTYDTTTHELDARIDRRDTATTADDLTQRMTWERPDPAGDWYRLTQLELVNTGGTVRRTFTQTGFAGFDTPLVVSECGEGGALCRSEIYAYDVKGQLVGHTLPDGSHESFTPSWCGTEASHVDPAGRVRTSTWDDRCLLTRAEFAGQVTSKTYDALLREDLVTTDPSGTAPTVTWTHFYDDAYRYPEDTLYLEARDKTLRSDGQLERVHRDGFGRVTKRVTCLSQLVGPGIDGASCEQGSERIAEWSLYGEDGLIDVSITPHTPGEAVATTRYGHDGYGRVISVQSPAHVATVGASWLTTLTYYRVGSVEEVAPRGRSTLTAFTTLSESKTVAGFFRGSRALDELGNVTTWMGSDAIPYVYGYDPLGRLWSISGTVNVNYLDAAGVARVGVQTRSFDRDLRDRVTRQSDPQGTVNTAYDAIGRPLSRSIGGAVVESLSYTDPVAVGAVATVTRTDESGKPEVLELDSLGRVQTRTQNGLVERFTYRANGQLATHTDPAGLVTTYSYDIHDRLSSASVPGQGLSTLQWTGADRLARLTDADGVADVYSYTGSGLLLKRLRGAWVLEERTYDSGGRVSSRKQEGSRTDFVYDELGRPLTIKRGMSGATPTITESLTYTSADRVATRTLSPVAGANSATTSFAYGPVGWLDSATEPYGTTRFDRDLAGRVRRATDAEGYARGVEYDARGRVSAYEQPGRGRLTVAYTVPAARGAATGLTLETTTDETGAQTRRYFDVLGRPVAIERADGSAQTWSYTGDRLVTEGWAGAGGALPTERRWEYDTVGRVKKLRGPAAPAAFAGATYDLSFTYSAAGRTLTTVVPDETTTFTYSNGWLATEKYQGLVRTLKRADPTRPWITSEELTTQTAGKPKRIRTFTRDALGRLLSESVTDGSGVTEVNSKSGLDAYGHPASESSTLGGLAQVTHEWTWDREGRPLERTTSTAGVANLTTRWDWYRNDVLKSVIAPSGVGYRFDYGPSFDHALDRVTDVNNPALVLAQVVGRDPRGLPTVLESAGGATRMELGYDVLGRMSSKLMKQNGATAYVYSVTRDALGRVAVETHDDRSAARLWSNSFSYDGTGRLTSEVRGKTGERWAYTLDRAGNRTLTTRTLASGAVELTSATYTGSRLTSISGPAGVAAPVYDTWWGTTRDVHGNVITRTPSGRERTIQGAGASSHTIYRDGQGLPVKMQTGQEPPRITIWDLDPARTPLEVRETGGDVLDYLVAEGMTLGQFRNGLAGFVGETSNGRGSVARFGQTALDDATAFGDGVQTPPGSDERFLYAGLETVPGAPGLMLARLRAYDPSLGRFLSPDPIGLAGGLHRTLYAEADPVQRRDPMGLSSCGGGGSPNIQPMDLMQQHELLDSGAGPSVSDQLAGLRAASDLANMTGPAIDLTSQAPFGTGPEPCGYTGCAPTGDDGYPGGSGMSTAVAAKDDSTREERRENRQAGRAERKSERKSERYWKKYWKTHGYIEMDFGAGPLNDGDGGIAADSHWVDGPPPGAEQPDQEPAVESSAPVEPKAPVTPPPPTPGDGNGGLGGDDGSHGSAGGDHEWWWYQGHDGPPANSGKVFQLPVPAEPIEVQPEGNGEPTRATPAPVRGPAPRRPTAPAPPTAPRGGFSVETSIRGHMTSAGPPGSEWGLEPLIDCSSGCEALGFKLTSKPPTVSIDTPFGKGTLGTDGKYKVTLKDGAFESGFDGSKVEVNVGVGPVGVSADSEGKVGGSLDLGAASISGDSTGAVEVSSQGITVSWDPASKTLDFKFEPEFSWGPAKVKTTMQPGHGLVTTLTINLVLAEGWTITIAQQYELSSTIPPEVYQQKMIDLIDDWFMNKVNGGQGGLDELIRALRGW